MENKNPPTYNDLNFSKLSEALKRNIARRKVAKEERPKPSKDESQTGQSAKQ